MTGLPQGWATAEVGELCDLINGRAFKPSDWTETGLPIVRIQNLNNPAKPFNFFDGEVRERFLIENGDLLFAWSGTPGTSFGAHVWMGGKAVLNQHIFKMKFDAANIDRDFFKSAINQKLNELIAKAHGGAGLQHVTKGRFEETEIPLPPLPEQRRIVRKLDTLSARSITARAHLTAIEKLEERYKRLVIGQLCLGGVAAQFQDQGDLPELPNGWEWSRAEDLCHWITKGTTPSKDELFAGQGEVPFIKVYNLTFSEKLDFSIEPTFVSSYTHNITLKRSKLFPGDVLINIVGPPLGKTAIVPDNFPEWNMNQAIAVFRPKERLFNRFLLYWLSSEWFLSWALSRSKATAGQRNLTLEICRDTPVPLPSFDEQREIVHRIETAFAKIDRLAVEAAKALRLLGHLDQRILAKAFAGNLVPQDPNDEPADRLLERIRRERAKIAPAKRRQRSNV